MATRPKAVIESHNGEEFSPITIAKNVLTDDGQNLHDILSDRKEDMMTPTIENSSSMFKVGQGDNVDYSGNVVNGAYDSMVLKGKTMVNCIQEPSGKDVVLPYEFEEGRYVTINDTKESGALGVELKGQTLVNLFGELAADLNNTPWSEDENNYNLDLATGNGQPTLSFRTLYTLPANKTYTLFINMTSHVTGVIHIDFRTPKNTSSSSNQRYFGEAGWQKLVFTTTEETGFVRMFNRNGMDNTYSISKSLILLEGDHTNTPIPNYFTGMTSCKTPILKTCGKNLFDVDNILYNTWVNSSDPNSVGNGNTRNTLDFTKVQPNQKIIASGLRLTGAYGYDANKKFIVVFNTGTLTTIGEIIPPNVYYIRLTFDNTVDFSNAQLEYGSTSTTYEPHKSSILSLPEEVVLRSLPNGVCDTFNTRTGVYTQRIGEVVLDGSSDEYWTDYKKELDTTQAFYTSYNIIGKCYDIISNSFPTITKGKMQASDIEGISTDDTSERGFVFIRIKKSRLSTQDTNGFKAWLQSNPVTVQYQLETPVITKINLPSTLKSWNTTTHIYSEIPENTLYPILSHSNPSYPVILKPSTKYSIVANSYSNDHTNSAINFNLGGATATTTVGNRVTTITTPSTLSNELLTMSGRGNKLNNVMVIEGDVVGDEPYFESICDCKSPILSNVGKNLFDKNNVMKDKYISGAGKETTEIGTNRNATDFIQVKPNTSYLLSGVQNSGVTNSNKQFYVAQYDANKKIIVVTAPSVGSDYVKITTEAKTKYIRTTIKDDDLDRCQIEQSTQATPHEPYKSNILSCNGDKIELTEDMFEQGTVSGAGGVGSKYGTMKENSTVRLRSKDIIKVKPNTNYRLFRENGYDGWCVAFDSNQAYLGKSYQTETFTTDSQTHYIVPVLKKTDNSTMVLSALSNFTLSEVDKTIVLRSLPNGVCDTLNVETGEYMERIGEAVFDGSENWVVNGYTNNQSNVLSYFSFRPNNLNCIYNQRYGGLSSKFHNIDCASSPNNEGWQIYNGQVRVNVLKSKLSEDSVVGFKRWLSQNPVTVQYQLDTPIVSTIDIQGFPYAYANGHVQLSSGSIEQSLTPKVEYSVVTNRNGQIRSNQKMVERHQKQLDRLQSMILTNLVNTQYEQTLTNLKYDLKNVREEVK